MTMPDGQPNGGTQHTGSATERMAGEVKAQAGRAKGKITEQARSSAEDVKNRASSAFSERKGQVAGQLTSVAAAVRRSTDQLRDEGQDRMAGYAESLAERVDNAATYVRDKDGPQLREDLEGLMRRQPALLIGTAFALGVLGARFLKSSQRDSEYEPDHTGVQRFEPYDEELQPVGQPTRAWEGPSTPGMGGFDATA